jgi:hypothetical protein
LAFKGPEEGSNLLDFRGAQLFAQLMVTHKLDGLGKLGDLTSVQIGAGLRNIPKRRYLEDLSVPLFAGDAEAAHVGIRVRHLHAHFLVAAAPHRDARVTASAADTYKGLEPFFFLRGESFQVALEIVVKP